MTGIFSVLLTPALRCSHPTHWHSSVTSNLQNSEICSHTGSSNTPVASAKTANREVLCVKEFHILPCVLQPCYNHLLAPGGFCFCFVLFGQFFGFLTQIILSSMSSISSFSICIFFSKLIFFFLRVLSQMVAGFCQMLFLFIVFLI